MIVTSKPTEEKATVYPQLATPYSGIGRICDVVDASKKHPEDPDRIRFIIELDGEWQSDDYRFTVATRPYYPSIAPETELRKFVETVLGRPINSIENKKGFDVETLIDAFVELTVETVKGKKDNKEYINITQLDKSDDIPDEWESNYVRIQDR